MSHDVLGPLLDYLQERADQPLGDHQLITGRTLQPFSFASQQGAQNLLDKASRALDRGDTATARRFVDRAVALPYDRHEEAAPAAIAAHMTFFNVVIDALEDSDEVDSGWLDAAIDVLQVSDEAARCDLRDVLMVAEKDFVVTSGEAKRIRAAIRTIPSRPELRDLELGPSDLGNHVMSILVACRAYRAALENATE